MITEEEALQNFAENLRAFLEKRGLTQKDLCRDLQDDGEKLSSLEAKISRALNGKHMPSPAFLLRISKALKIKMEKLLE